MDIGISINQKHKWFLIKFKRLLVECFHQFRTGLKRWAYSVSDRDFTYKKKDDLNTNFWNFDCLSWSVRLIMTSCVKHSIYRHCFSKTPLVEFWMIFRLSLVLYEKKKRNQPRLMSFIRNRENVPKKSFKKNKWASKT